MNLEQGVTRTIIPGTLNFVGLYIFAHDPHIEEKSSFNLNEYVLNKSSRSFPER